jgi:c-di-GMP-binding flagellar brake protein YcgR
LPIKVVIGCLAREDSEVATIEQQSKEQPKSAGTQHGIERRRHTRHQYIQEIHIWRVDGSEADATTFEISQGGMSAATTLRMYVGEAVELSSILGYRVHAIVRRKVGTMYGFEFIRLPEELKQKLVELSNGLPLFKSLVDI